MTATAGRSCPDDLTDRRRRALGSELEQRALAAHLDQCEPCKAAVILAGMFDGIVDTLPGDEQIVARVADRAAKGMRTRTPMGRLRWMPAGRSRMRVWAIAAGLLIVFAATGATAWMLLRREKSTASPVGTTSGRGSGLRPGVASGSRSASNSRLASVPIPDADAVEAPSLGPGAVRSSPDVLARAGNRRHPPMLPDATAAAAAATAVATAETLFAEANAVRRAGELRRAVALYRALQRRFPRSAEARSSSISEGNLLLGLGDLEPAVAAFDSYLTHPGGDLTEEALFGRGRVLARLGRDADENTTWVELLKRFPQSAYRQFATKRIDELGSRSRQPTSRPSLR